MGHAENKRGLMNGTRGRKPKEESRAEELHTELAAWRQLGFLRPSLRKLAAQLGTSHQLLSHCIKSQDEWEARRQALRSKESGDFGGALRWYAIAGGIKLIRRMEREAKKTGTLDRSRVRMLENFAKVGLPGARELLSKMNSAHNAKNNLPLSLNASAKSFRSHRGQMATAPR